MARGASPHGVSRVRRAYLDHNRLRIREAENLYSALESLENKGVEIPEHLYCGIFNGKHTLTYVHELSVNGEVEFTTAVNEAYRLLTKNEEKALVYKQKADAFRKQLKTAKK